MDVFRLVPPFSRLTGLISRCFGVPKRLSSLSVKTGCLIIVDGGMFLTPPLEKSLCDDYFFELQRYIPLILLHVSQDSQDFIPW